MWFSHTVFLPATTPTYSGVDWWQINPATSAVLQFGRVSTSANKTFYYYPSINVNPAGDALLGYCSSSSLTYASASYSFHASTDPANSMQAIYTYKSGLASYYKTFGGGRNRWGDFTGTAVDPVNNSFWNFSEFSQTGNKWGTVIANVASSTGHLANGGSNAERTTGNSIEQNSKMKLYPNPAKDNLNLDYTSAGQGEIKLSVYNIQGSKVINYNQPIHDGVNTINVNTSQLAKGAYTIEIEQNGTVQRERFVISR